MARLTITLFGAPRYELDDVPIAFNHRKPVALLTYLLLTRQEHTRDSLAALFWPEHAQARTFLRNNLYIIRKVLGRSAAQWLHTSRDTVLFQPDAHVWVDLFAFRDDLAACPATRHPAQEVCPSCMARLERAMDLYRADFLAGFSLRACPAFDEWQFFQSERLRRELTGVLQKLIAGYSRQPDWEAAIQAGQSWLLLDPLDEQAHRTLMQVYTHAGRPTAALRQYQECERILAAELHIDPDQETQAIFAAIKNRRTLPPIMLPVNINPSPRPANPPQNAPMPPEIMHGQVQPPHNLPTQLTPLLGRAEEQTRLQVLLRRPEVRLVTVTGPGGVGKTRLGLQVAEDVLNEFADGVYFVPLAPIQEANLIAPTIIHAIGANRTMQQAPLETLKLTIQSKKMLLVLDNFEHVISAAPLVTALLAACCGLKIMVTSREVLRLQGEHEFVTPPFLTPLHPEELTLDTLSRFAAVQLFLTRTQAFMPDFVLDKNNAPAVAKLCGWLDGLPLAIELAAGRIKLFSPQILLKKLTSISAPPTLDILNLGGRDMPARHQTLRHTIAWSYELLTSAEQKLFRGLSVFVDSFSLEEATAVCAEPANAEQYIARGLQIYWPSAEFLDAQTVSLAAQTPDHVAPFILDAVTSFVNKSLVKRVPQQDGEPRFVLLETIREYGLEQLQLHGELAAAQRAHAAYFFLLIVEAQPHLHGPEESRWMHRLTLAHNNLHAALAWAVAQRFAELAMRLGDALSAYWLRTHYRYEAIDRLQRIVVLADDAPPSFASSRFFFCLALGAEWSDGKAAGAALYERSLAISRAVDDKFTMGNCLNKLGGLAYRRGDYAKWETCLEEAETLKLEAGGHYIHALVMGFTGREYIQIGRFAEGRALCEKSLALHRELGDKWGLCTTLINFSQAALLQGDVEKAEVLAQECLELAQALNAEHIIARARNRLGEVALAHADYRRAQELLHDALQIHQRQQNYHAQVGALEAFAALAVAQQQPARALLLAAFLEQQFIANGSVLPPVLQQNFDRVVASAREQLTDDVAVAAWAAGQEMTLDVAVNYALTEARQ